MLSTNAFDRKLQISGVILIVGLVVEGLCLRAAVRSDLSYLWVLAACLLPLAFSTTSIRWPRACIFIGEIGRPFLLISVSSRDSGNWLIPCTNQPRAASSF